MQERLGKVEDDLEAVKTLLGAAARLTEDNSEAIGQLTSRIDQLGRRFDQLTVSQEQLTERINQLANLMVQFIQNAEADRATMREIQADIRGLQTENRQILEYLFGRQGN